MASSLPASSSSSSSSSRAAAAVAALATAPPSPAQQQQQQRHRLRQPPPPPRQRDWIELAVLVALVLVTLLLVLLTSGALSRLQAVAGADRARRPTTLSGLPALQLSGSQPTLPQYDCDTDIVYSMADADCSTLCRPPGIYHSRNGVCVNQLTFRRQTADDECDPERGLLAYLIGDPQFGQTRLLCLSIDPGVQPDTVRKENRFCTGGTIEVNYLQQFPQLANCACPEGQILAVLAPTSVTRPRALCVDQASAPLYRFMGALHDDARAGGELPRVDFGKVPSDMPINLLPGPEAPPRYLSAYKIWRKKAGRLLFGEHETRVLW